MSQADLILSQSQTPCKLRTHWSARCSPELPRNHQEITRNQEDVWTRQKPNKQKWMVSHWPHSFCLPKRILHPSAGQLLLYTVRTEKCDARWSRTATSFCWCAFLGHWRSHLSVRNSMVCDSTVIRHFDSDIGYLIQHLVFFDSSLEASSLCFVFFLFCYLHHWTAVVMASREENQFALMRSCCISFNRRLCFSDFGKNKQASQAWSKNS